MLLVYCLAVAGVHVEYVASLVLLLLFVYCLLRGPMLRILCRLFFFFLLLGYCILRRLFLYVARRVEESGSFRHRAADLVAGCL